MHRRPPPPMHAAAAAADHKVTVSGTMNGRSPKSMSPGQSSCASPTRPARNTYVMQQLPLGVYRYSPLLQRMEIEANAPNENVRFCFPPMLPMGSMHSKLQLLRFPNYLRIVVPSGNFVPYDWGETGTMENVRGHPSPPPLPHMPQHR